MEKKNIGGMVYITPIGQKIANLIYPELKSFLKKLV